MKKKFIVLFLIISLTLFYLKAIKPYKEEQDIKTELRSKWSVDIGKADKLKKMKSSRPQWHGEHHKFILFELNDSGNVLNYIRDNNLYLHEINSDFKKRIIEIENDLNIEERDRIDFNTDYYYTNRIKHNFNLSSEKTNDILYIVLIKKYDNAKIFFIEDLNVLDLERSF